MQVKEFHLLVETAVIQRVTIFDLAGRGFEIWAYGDELPSSVGNRVKLARGGARIWSTLDSAYRFIRDSGFCHVVEIDFYSLTQRVANAEPAA
jgi:hypothetical protein